LTFSPRCSTPPRWVTLASSTGGPTRSHTRRAGEISKPPYVFCMGNTHTTIAICFVWGTLVRQSPYVLYWGCVIDVGGCCVQWRHPFLRDAGGDAPHAECARSLCRAEVQPTYLDPLSLPPVTHTAQCVYGIYTHCRRICTCTHCMYAVHSVYARRI
jgi:hypothetical protein